jgi:hypothetical protein
MGIRPDFTAQQVRELKSLGVCDGQVAELRKALVTTRHFLVKQPSNNDTRDVLAKVESSSASLLTKLSSIALAIDSAHDKAGGLIEKSYWQQRPDDGGHTAMLHLIPRLQALNEAARYGLDEIPTAKPERYRSADPAPVERIHNALVYGWSKTCMNDVGLRTTWSGEESEVAAFVEQEGASPRPKYPKRLAPSASDGCGFRRVVGICYAAVGGNPDPERPIKQYVKQLNARRNEAVDEMMKLLHTPPKKSRR